MSHRVWVCAHRARRRGASDWAFSLGYERSSEAHTALLRYDPPMLELSEAESGIDSTRPSLETSPTPADALVSSATPDAFLTLGANEPHD